MGIVVEKPGILTTVQDAGRFGYQQYGVSPAGPMDTRSFQLANILTGNRPDEGALEFTVAGPSLRFGRQAGSDVSGSGCKRGRDVIFWNSPWKWLQRLYCFCRRS